MTVSKKTIYSSMEVTEEELKFCNTLLEVAKDTAEELHVDPAENLYEIVYDLIINKGKIDFDDWR